MRALAQAEDASAPAIEVEGLSKYFAATGLLYAPAASIFARYRKGRPIGVEGGVMDDDDDEGGGDDDIDDTTDVDQTIVEAEEHEPVWALRDVAFTVPEGRVLGVVGGRGAGRTTLIRILGRTMTPTSGRAVLRGRVAPTSELVTNFVRPDLDPVGNAKSLARLFHIPRDERDAFVAHVAELVFGPGRDSLPGALGEWVAIRRIATAVALDPGADVVLLDEVGYPADAAFQERALERVEKLRAAGATIVLASQDLALLRRFCDEAILLEHGEVVAVGAVDDVVTEFRRRRTAESQHRVANDLPLHSFNGAAALLGTHVLLDGATVVVRLDFETAEPGVLVLASVRFRRGDGVLVFEQTEPSMLGDARRYAFSLRVPADALDPGPYALDVQADVDHDGGRTTIGRNTAARVRLGGGRLLDIDGGAFGEAVDPAPGVLDSAPVAADWVVEEV